MVGQPLDSSRRGWIKLPSDLVNRCWTKGEEAVAAYSAGKNNASLAYSYRGAESNVKLWAASKMAECVFAIESGVDPVTAINWSAHPDKFDVMVGRRRVDVKQTHPGGRYLLWSVKKMDIFATTEFDCMVLTKVDVDLAEGKTFGWVTKEDFRRRMRIADRDHKLDEGTPYLEDAELNLRMKEFYSYAKHQNGHPLEFFCEICGRLASYGHGVSLRQNRIGIWFCREHRPLPKERG